ncbi:NAD-dependent epimerase/dehydratase family protein [Ectothiorhodospiraceae bacterium 2226]|nr:NAD-dependent epimerase/dehydratase family protein [Ectothiorhodospiraceae bacterium 2226]
MVEAKQQALHGARVFVTGGTGAIGGRLVERLVLERNAHVSVLARNLSRAARVARFPVALYKGEVTDPQAVRAAMRDCDFVFHCAYGNAPDPAVQRRVNVDGTHVVLDAALQLGVRQVVHVSTCSVYGFVPPNGKIDETAVRRRSGNVYADTKIDAEALALSYARDKGLPVAVVQPTAVYGPGLPVWTNSVLGRLKRERMFLVEGGEGLSNAVYVDDVVDGMLLAAECPEAAGEAFLLSGPDLPSWREFFGAYEAMLGVRATVPASVDEIAAHWRAWEREQRAPSVFLEPWRMLNEEKTVRKRIRRTREVQYLLAAARAMKGRLRGAPNPKPPTRRRGAPMRRDPAQEQAPLQPISPEMLNFFRARTHFETGKAQRVLGYRPRYDLTRGMRMTQRWAEWANLLK